ncbi:MAG: hypothetical protein FWD88_06770 [Treponema sp.]|nr:hypothetical protein [Treponema sp.]
MALLAAMLLVVQPAFAQDMIIIDLEHVTDEELADALGVATELELIMRAEWEPAEDEHEAEAEEPELPTVETEETGYAAEEHALTPEAEEHEYIADPVPTVEAEDTAEYEEPAPVAEAEEPVYIAEEPIPVTEVETEEPAYTVEEPILAVEPVEPIYVADDIPEGIRHNVYFLESLRLVRLAEEAYEQGDYEAAATYAQKARRYAQLSDDYIAQQMYPEEAVEVVATPGNGYPLPATFTVRSWNVYRDCLWNIAARPEIFGDPRQWPVLFNANRHRMPDPNNPHLILPGMVLEIPSIDGETREGAWRSGRVYRR